MIRGVTRRPKTTPGGLDVVSVIYASNHRKYFVIAKRPDSKFPSHYVVETVNKSGKFAKRQIQDLYDRVLDSQGQAKHAIRLWDAT